MEKLGHKVRDLHNPIGRKTKEPLGIFFANLEPASNNKEVFQIRRLCRSVVTIEPLLKFNDVPQCFTCQGFGHTQLYCFLEHLCVKCGGHHDSRACAKRRTRRHAAFTAKPNTLPRLEGALLIKRQRHSKPPSAPQLNSVRPDWLENSLVDENL